MHTHDDKHIFPSPWTASGISSMTSFIIEEWVAMMPAETIRMVIDSLDDDKLLHLHQEAVKSNIDVGYRPDFIDLFPEFSSL